MANNGFLHRAFHLYYDGFRSMTLGRTLWIVIAIKLFIIFVVLKIFFFPNFLNSHAEKGQEAEFVAGELLERQPERDNNTHIINNGGDEHRSDSQPPSLGG